MNDADEADAAPLYRLLLLVAGNASLRSRRAIENVRSVCDGELMGIVDLEVIDIHQRPDLAKTHDVVAAPTLLKLRPLPVRRIVGDLSARDRVIASLELMQASQAEP